MRSISGERDQESFNSLDRVSADRGMSPEVATVRGGVELTQLISDTIMGMRKVAREIGLEGNP